MPLGPGGKRLSILCFLFEARFLKVSSPANVTANHTKITDQLLSQAATPKKQAVVESGACAHFSGVEFNN